MSSSRRTGEGPWHLLLTAVLRWASIRNTVFAVQFLEVTGAWCMHGSHSCRQHQLHVCVHFHMQRTSRRLHHASSCLATFLTPFPFPSFSLFSLMLTCAHTFHTSFITRQR